MRAIDRVEERIRTQHGAASSQMRELLGVKEREAAGFTSALRETFKTIVFPTGRALRRVDDFRMEFDGNDYSGEQQIVDTLSKRGKLIPSERFDAEFENLRLEAEEILFDADAVQFGSLRRNAAVRPGWYWLPRGGLEQLVKTAVQRGFWRDKEGLVAKKWERRTRVSARLDDFGPNPLETGRFLINVTAEDADLVYFSEKGPPDPAKDKKLDGRAYETEAAAIWFLAVDSKGEATTGDAYEWRAPIRVKPDVRRVSDGYRVSVLAIPRMATIRATFDESDPKTGPAVSGEIEAPAGATRLRVVAEVNGQFSEEENARLADGLRGDPRKPEKVLKLDAPVLMTSRFDPKDTAAAFSALDRLSKTLSARVHGGSVELSGGRSEGDHLTFRMGKDVPFGAGDLDALTKTLVERLHAEAPTLKLRLDGIAFPSGRELRDFCDAVGEDFSRVTWTQD
jgi:hypothetical protein